VARPLHACCRRAANVCCCSCGCQVLLRQCARAQLDCNAEGAVRLVLLSCRIQLCMQLQLSSPIVRPDCWEGCCSYCYCGGRPVPMLLRWAAAQLLAATAAAAAVSCQPVSGSWTCRLTFAMVWTILQYQSEDPTQGARSTTRLCCRQHTSGMQSLHSCTLLAFLLERTSQRVTGELWPLYPLHVRPARSQVHAAAIATTLECC
jgi:hypothetical protein